MDKPRSLSRENVLEGPASPSLSRWSTLAAGVVGSAASSGVISIVVFGMTLKLIADDFGWYRSQVSIGLACFYIFNGVGALVLGHFIARHGVRWPAIAFVIGFASANLLIGDLSASALLFVPAFIWLGLTSGGCTSMPYAVGVAGWFDKGRGLALAIAVSGTGLGHIIFPSYAEWLLTGFGWRGVYVGAAAFVAALGLFALIALYREPPVSQRVPKMELSSFFEIYKKHRDIRLLAISIFLLSFASIGLSVSMPAIVTDAGFSMRDAALILTAYGASNWIAKLAAGFFLDRIHVRYVAATIFFLVAIAGAIMLASPSLAAAYIAAILIGCGVGAEADIMTYGASRYFEPAGLGKAVGAIWVTMPWGAGLGVVAGASAFDLFGGYETALVAYGLSAAAAAAFMLRVGPYKQFHQGE